MRAAVAARHETHSVDSDWGHLLAAPGHNDHPRFELLLLSHSSLFRLLFENALKIGPEIRFGYAD
jgi:hypothetical protein